VRFESESMVEEGVTPSRRARLWADTESEAQWPRTKRNSTPDSESWPEPTTVEPTSKKPSNPPQARSASKAVTKWPTLTRAHAISFAGLLLFTAVTYFRPYELIAALSDFRSMAFWLAVATLIVFIPTQLSADGTITARPLEVNVALLLALAGLLSVPFATAPSEAWATFLDFAKVIAMFIVMVNVVRTERRWRWLMWLSLIVSITLSIYALSDYRLGHFDIRGERIEGVIRKGLFENPNDMALHLVTMIPIAVGLLFVARSYTRKALYLLIAVLMVGATIVTFSRGGFVGLIVACFVLAWKLGRRNRVVIVALFMVAAAFSVAALPSEFLGRIVSLFGGDDGGSAVSRQHLLWQSIQVTMRHPILGIGMGNFHNVSDSEQVSHNAYTQVSSEMGVPAMILSIIFMVAALRRLHRIEKETYDSRKRTRIYYLAVGLQAALVGYMVCSFFASVAYLWYIYYLVGFALCLHRLYEVEGADGVFGRALARKPMGALDVPGDGDIAPLPGSLFAVHER
jgi:putative inorganic carbon (HCO3(-)) transporter